MFSSDDPTLNTTAKGFDGNKAFGLLSGVLREAASGDLIAQRVLRNLCVESMNSLDTDPYGDITVLQGIFYGRLCAAWGDPKDSMYLAGMLIEAGDMASTARPAVAETMRAEAISILERLSDEGNELAAAASVMLTDQFPEATVRRAAAILAGEVIS